MTIPKHDAGQAKTRKRKQRTQTLTSERTTAVLTGPDMFDGCPGPMHHDINYLAGLSGIEQSLDWIAKGIGRLTSDEHAITVTSAGCLPIKITLADNDEDDTMSDLVIAAQRIADSLAKLAGLNRPPLEPEWSRDSEVKAAIEYGAPQSGSPQS